MRREVVILLFFLACAPLCAKDIVDTLSFENGETRISPQVVSVDTTRHKDGTRVYNDTAVYQGMSIKLDLLNSILYPSLTKGKTQTYEIAMNWRIISRLYPTFELGYALAEYEAEGGQYKGQGGFARVGLDINPLKKHPHEPHAMLVGLRLGTAVQGYDVQNVIIHSPYWGSAQKDYFRQIGADCWGEIVAGCQVQVWEGLQMGWMVRYKILFTRNAPVDKPLSFYIPGFGQREDMAWGVNYYIGYKF